MKLVRAKTRAQLRAADDFLAQHGPVGGKPASACDGTWLLYCEPPSQIIGVACANWKAWKHYYLSNAAVHPSWRGERLQVRLIAARLHHARRMRREARTYTHETNRASMLNLIRAGMFPVLRYDEWVYFSSAAGDPAAP